MQQVGVAAAGKVGAADAAAEQAIADLGQPAWAVEIDQMAGGMARAVQDLQRLGADRDRIAGLQPARRREGQQIGQSEHLRLHGQRIEQEGVRAVRADDRQAERRGQLGGAAYMVHMAMGEQDLCGSGAERAHGGEDALHLAARVDDGGVAGFGTAEDAAVLLQRRDRDDLKVHPQDPPR